MGDILNETQLSGDNKTWIICTVIVCVMVFAIVFFIYKGNSEVSTNIAKTAEACIQQGKNWVPSAVAGVFQCVGVSQQ